MGKKSKDIKKGLMDFTEQTFKSADAGNCPLLLDWFGKTFESIRAANPSDIKPEKLKMWRHKMIYALYLVVNPKFSKKKFAEAFRIAYGTARNWKNDSKVIDYATTFAHEFIDAYVDKMNSILAKPQKGQALSSYIEKRDAELNKLFIEAIFYKNDYLIKMLLGIMKSIADGKVDSKVERSIEDLLFAPMVVNTIIKFFNVVGSVYDASPKLIKSRADHDKSQIHYNHTVLRNLIEKGDKKEALEATIVLENYAKQNMEHICFLETELLKTRKKYEKK